MMLLALEARVWMVAWVGVGCSVDWDEDGFLKGDDCDDRDASVFPGAHEICDGVDNDCDGVVDDDALDAAALFVDADSDGFGVDATEQLRCSQAGWVDRGGDCDDADATLSPGEPERCDGIDNDCDQQIEDQVVTADGVPYATMEQALEGAPDAAVYELCPTSRSYDVWLQVEDRTVTIRGGGSTPDAAALTSGGPLGVMQGGTLVLDNLTVRDVPFLAGLQVTGDGHLSATDVVIRDNVLGLSVGSGAKGALVELSRVSLVDNGGKDASFGGAVNAAGIFDLRMDDCTVEGNVARVGGGIRTFGSPIGPSSVVITNSVIRNNEALGTGGALHVTHDGYVRIVSSVVTDNVAGYSGGAAFVATSVNAVLESSLTHWGGPGDDNGPNDIVLSKQFDATPYDFDGVASFTCSGATSTCE
ncbi:MAG: putative metal-binding motif-containing protein [Myxococcales bacterium]|nr:putative metal-binding motif-containing protein [Myxococcales bacterium]